VVEGRRQKGHVTPCDLEACEQCEVEVRLGGSVRVLIGNKTWMVARDTSRLIVGHELLRRSSK
jgi:hypothetical protein